MLVLALSSLAQSSSPPATPVHGSEGDDKTNPTPTFHAESRQILVEAKVWTPPAANGKSDPSLIPKESLDRLGGVTNLPTWPTPAKGLTFQNFRVLENDVEQRINFLRETDFPAVDTTGQWDMHPVFGGTWGFLYEQATPAALGRPGGIVSWTVATASYILGYTPAPLKPGECRTIQIFVQGKVVDLNRSRYCDGKSSNDKGIPEASTVAARIQQWTDSKTRQSIKLATNSYTFWSSGVLHLVKQTTALEDQGHGLPATDFTYHIEVHDAQAPAMVQISTEFDLPQKYWEGSECRKHNPDVRVAGVVYTSQGQVAAQFDEARPCLEPTPSGYLTKFSKHQVVVDRYFKPTRFDTQLELPPGDYELRVAVREEKDLGKARLPLHIRSFNSQDLTISDVVPAGIARDSSWVLAEAASVSPFPVVPSPLVSRNIQFFPELDPTLRKGAPLTVYFEIYEPALQVQAASLFCEVRITDLKTGSSVLNTGPMSANKWLIPGNGAVPIGLKLDTGKFKKGSYRVEVQASDSGGRESGWRGANFSIQ